VGSSVSPRSCAHKRDASRVRADSLTVHRRGPVCNRSSLGTDEWLITGTAFQQFVQLRHRRSCSRAAVDVAHAGTGACAPVRRCTGCSPRTVLPSSSLRASRSSCGGATGLPWRHGGARRGLAFMFWAQISGSVLQLLRYFIVVIPLVILMSASRWPPEHSRLAASSPPRTRARTAHRWLTWLWDRWHDRGRRGSDCPDVALGPGRIPCRHGPTINVGYAAEFSAGTTRHRSPRLNAWRVAFRHRSSGEPVRRLAPPRPGWCSSTTSRIRHRDVIVNTQQYVITSDRTLAGARRSGRQRGAISWCRRSRRWASSTPSTARTRRLMQRRRPGNLVKQFNSGQRTIASQLAVVPGDRHG